MSDYFEEMERELAQFDRYYLTVDRESLNEIMSALAMTGKVETVVDDTGDIAFNIPTQSKINVMSVNIPDVMMGVLIEMEKEQANLEEGSERFEEIESTKEGIRFAIDFTKTILTQLKEEETEETEE